MFIFIGGVHPKTKTLDSTPRICPLCGQLGLKLKRIDHYFNLFFIPLFPLKKGSPFYQCDYCSTLVDENQQPITTTYSEDKTCCPYCGRPASPDFSYCPYCGRPL
jgi:hypothetical protein